MQLTDSKEARAEFVRPSPPQLGGSPPLTWLHSPPTQMPWGTKQPPLVRFTGGLYGGGLTGNPSVLFGSEICSSQYRGSSPMTFLSSSDPLDHEINSAGFMPGFHAHEVMPNAHGTGLKRKADIDEAEMLSAVNKLHISDTTMASHRAGFHALNQQEAEEQADAPRLVLSEELKQMTAQDEQILPKTLIDRMRSKNSMALVLWQPPKSRMAYFEPDDEDDGNNNNNNGESVDLMAMYSGGPSSSNEGNGQEDVDMETL